MTVRATGRTTPMIQGVSTVLDDEEAAIFRNCFGLSLLLIGGFLYLLISGTI